MLEKKLLIKNQIAGLLTFPDGVSDTSKTELPAVLMLHGFGTDKNEVNGVYKQIAEDLAKNNIISLRIDFRGYGDSVDAGQTEKFTVDDMLSDAVAAFNHLITLSVDKNKMGVIGFSLGAAVALMLSRKVSFNSMALVSPTLNLMDDFLRFLSKETMSQLAACQRFIEVDLQWRKINISKAFYDSLNTSEPAIAADQFKGNMLCIAGDQDFSADNAKMIIDKSPSAEKILEIVADADHVFNFDGLSAVASTVCNWMSLFNRGEKMDASKNISGLKLQ